jgi:general secretion pathway protein A
MAVASAAPVVAVVAPASASAVAAPLAAGGAAAALQAAASSPGGSAAQRGPAVVDARPLLPEPGMGVFKQDEQQAWRELAPLWGWQASAGAAGDFCQAARAQRLRCFRTSAGTLTQLRQLDRPATLLLRIDDGPPRLARLVALDGRRAVLAAGATAYSLSLDDLARSWRGEFTTLWRAPEGYAGLLTPGAQGQAVEALAQGLAAERRLPAPPAGQALDRALATQLATFQRAQGLKADGIAGPTTFMQLNRALGVAEPRLVDLPPER